MKKLESLNGKKFEKLERGEMKTIQGGWCTSDAGCEAGQVCGYHYSGGRVCRKIQQQE